MTVVLREIIPDGTQWGTLGEILPHWASLEFGQDLKGSSSILFEYANEGSHFSRIKTGMYVVPVIDGNYKWMDSIYYVQELQGSAVPGSESRKTTFSGVNLKGRLDTLRWMPAIGSTYIDEAMFRLQNISPGAVVRNGVENFLSRARNTYKDPVNWISKINDVYTSTQKVKVDEYIEPGTTVEEMVQKYQDLGLLTIQFEGFQLNILNYESVARGVIRDRTKEVQLKVGFNIRGGEYSESNKELITALLVKGAPDIFTKPVEGQGQPSVVQWVIAPQSVIDKHGYHESLYTVADAAQANTLRIVGEAYLNKHLEPRYSTSYTMVDGVTSPSTGERVKSPVPLYDFECGDKISILTEKGTVIERVYAITLSYDNPNSPSIGLTLNDFFEDYMVTFDQRLKRLGV